MVLNLQSSEIRTWLVAATSENGDYRHLHLVENPRFRTDAIRVLRSIRKEVHKDAKRYLAKLTQNSLDPLGDSVPSSVADAYPGSLHLSTKKAYFGEIMAGVVAENFASTPPGQWRVPVFLFRYHQSAFDQLERWREVGTSPSHVPGQSGDDCLAFHVGGEGFVTATLVGEGKCTNDHHASMIADAHSKVSSTALRPISLSRAMGILHDLVAEPEAAEWLNFLSELYHRKDLSDKYKRADLVSYICGRFPKTKPTWAPTLQPHSSYNASRELECVELHLSDVDELVKEIYED